LKSGGGEGEGEEVTQPVEQKRVRESGGGEELLSLFTLSHRRLPNPSNRKGVIGCSWHVAMRTLRSDRTSNRFSLLLLDSRQLVPLLTLRKSICNVNRINLLTCLRSATAMPNDPRSYDEWKSEDRT
jgi:hypothetical protein